MMATITNTHANENFEILGNVYSKFTEITKKHERFLGIQEEVAEDLKETVKHLYDYAKIKENAKPVLNALPKLIIAKLDEEQIWQELNIQNEEIHNEIVKDVALLFVKKDALTFDEDSDSPYEEDVEDSCSEVGSQSDADNESRSENSSHSHEEETDERNKPQFRSEIDDEFFKLSEMENFCDAVEKDESKNDLSMHLFNSQTDDDDDENRLIRYNDFFGPNREKTKKSKMRIHEDNFENDDGELSFNDKGDSEDENHEKLPPSDELSEPDSNDLTEAEKSVFQSRQERLKSKIKTLEDDAMKEKEWYLKGEVTAASRPQNSALEEYLEFDVGARSAPIFTEKTTLRLEDVIRQRMKDKAWDDVKRKVKPVEDIREYRKRLVLDQEKSKVSLAEIYEQAYIKQRDADLNTNEPREEVEPDEHKEITKMMRTLFTKLDALSNLHFTPKMVEPEVRIVSNLPAINMEEVAPIATSDATLLAPEEVKDKKKGELVGERERTSTDKKRDRRKKKFKQTIRAKQRLKKENATNTNTVGLGSRYTKDQAKRTLDTLTKERNIDRMVETTEKHVRTSSAFFSKLQDEVKSAIKRKDQPTKKKSLEKMTAKRIKL